MQISSCVLQPLQKLDDEFTRLRNGDGVEDHGGSNGTSLSMKTLLEALPPREKALGCPLQCTVLHNEESPNDGSIIRWTRDERFRQNGLLLPVVLECCSETLRDWVGCDHDDPSAVSFALGETILQLKFGTFVIYTIPLQWHVCSRLKENRTYPI